MDERRTWSPLVPELELELDLELELLGEFLAEGGSAKRQCCSQWNQDPTSFLTTSVAEGVHSLSLLLPCWLRGCCVSSPRRARKSETAIARRSTTDLSIYLLSCSLSPTGRSTAPLSLSSLECNELERRQEAFHQLPFLLSSLSAKIGGGHSIHSSIA